MRLCSKCGEDFKLMPGKPGFANVCARCTELKPPKEPAKLMAEVSWENKHTPVIVVTTAKRARAFNKAGRRSSFGPALPFSPRVSGENAFGRDED